jgi:TPR repeat protein
LAAWGFFLGRDGISKDSAYNYLERATLSKHPDAMYWMARYYKEKGEVDRAKWFYVLSAECGMPNAIKALGLTSVEPCYN